MHWLTRFFAFILVLALMATALSWSLTTTLLDSENLNKNIQRADVPRLAAEVAPKLLGEHAQDPKATMAAISQIVTVDFVKDKLGEILPQLIRHLTAGGAMATIDLRDLGVSARAAGLLKPGEELPKFLSEPQPISLGDLDKPLTDAAHILEILRWAGPAAALVLMAIIALLAKGRRWRSIGSSLIAAAIATASLAALVWLPVGLSSFVTSSQTGQILQPLVHGLVSTIAAAQSVILLWFAAAYAGLAVICYIIHPIEKMFGAFHRKHDHEKSQH